MFNVQLENRPELNAPNWRTPAIKQLYIELKDSLSLKRWRVLVFHSLMFILYFLYDNINVLEKFNNYL